MKSLHDFNSATRKADGKPVVVFTYPKLVKTSTGGTVYYLDIKNNIKHGITSPQILAENNWNWDMVNVIEEKWLKDFKPGSNISEKIFINSKNQTNKSG